ncbi:MAG: molybdopterin-dependent oxidoreductase [Chloroflexi bacterium]|nr:molybdopterin-dependent oxidoreductase [Chloroflexota bacterium]
MSAGRRQVKTLCPMNCNPTYCGMLVEVENDRVIAIKGDLENPDSRGFLCMRGHATREIPHNSRRLLSPLRRVGKRGEDRWQPISWEDAYGLLVGHIQQTSRNRVGFWMGHGALATGIVRPLIMRFGYLGGFQVWNPAMICWALGAYGLALTGVLEANTKEDMAAHSHTILFWGANLASQPSTAPHLVEARKRNAHIIHIDCRQSEVSRHADEVYLIQPGTDAALALAMAHVIIEEGLTDADFIKEHTLGFEAFAASSTSFTPEWAESITGLAAERIRSLARRYATQTPAMIVLGGSSMFKHQSGWEASRAIACLPALTGQLGVAGGGLGPRHRAFVHADGLADLQAIERRPPGNYIPNHMASIAEALSAGHIDVLFLLGTNMLSSFSDTNALEKSFERVGLVVAYDIFMNETIRRTADLILPGTIWLEELGMKDTASHIYLMERALQPEGEARSLMCILRDLAEQLEIADFFPWQDEEEYLNALLAPQRTPEGASLTVEQMRQCGGAWQKSNLSHVAYPQRRFHTPSGKVEFWSERAQKVGLPPLPTYTPAQTDSQYPLQLKQGRTLTAFHAFYDEGRALPSLARANPEPELWIHPADAQQRGIGANGHILIYNERGQMRARARVTETVLPGVVWMRDGWVGLNSLTSGVSALTPSASGAVDPYGIPAGQTAFDALVEVCNA